MFYKNLLLLVTDKRYILLKCIMEGTVEVVFQPEHNRNVDRAGGHVEGLCG